MADDQGWTAYPQEIAAPPAEAFLLYQPDSSWSGPQNRDALDAP